MKRLARYAPISIVSATVGMGVFFAVSAMAQSSTPLVTHPVSQYPNQTGASGFACDPGYSPVMFHYDETDSNNADWFECQ